MNHFFLYFPQVKFIGNQNTSTGNSSYELTNLPITIGMGNVLTSISDLVYPISSGGTDIDYYQVGINQVTDYSPFGVQLDGRTISGGINGNDVRYGFQNQERDDEIKGSGNSLNYEYRMHDPRLGRFFAIDPLAAKFPWNSVYAFSENRVIDGVELEGLEVEVLNENNEIQSGPYSTENQDGSNGIRLLDDFVGVKSKEILLEVNKSQSFKDLLVEMDAFHNLTAINDHVNTMADFRGERQMPSHTTYDKFNKELTINLNVGNASYNYGHVTPENNFTLYGDLAFEAKNASAFSNGIYGRLIDQIGWDPNYRIQDYAYDAGMIEATCAWMEDVVMGELGYKPVISNEISADVIQNYFVNEIMPSNHNLANYIVDYNMYRPRELPFENKKIFNIDGYDRDRLTNDVLDTLRSLFGN